VAQILKGTRLYAGAADLTGRSNKIDVSAEVEEKDRTTFGSYDEATDRLWKEVIGGNASAKITGGGFWEAGDPGLVDDELWSRLGEHGQAWSALPSGIVVGAPAYLASTLETSYQLLGQQGEVAPWQGAWSTSGPLVRGRLLHPPGTARTATGDGTAVEHVAVPAGMNLYAALHVLSVAGTDTPTITVAIESDDTADFDGSETTRATFAAATDLGDQVVTVMGPVTDTFWRATWTISGTDPSFLFLVTFGVAI
jgi:hypothetical protein